MADTVIGTNDPQAVKRWATDLMVEAIDQTYFGRFLGRSNKSIIQLFTDLDRQAGDVVKVDLRVTNRDVGIEGDNTLEGNEVAMQFVQDEVAIDQLRQAHRWARMSQQRTVHQLRMEARDSLADWFARKYDQMMFAYLAGTVGNDTLEPITNVPFAANALDATPASHLVGGNVAMTLDLIDEAKTIAKTVNPRLRPTRVDGRDYFVMVLHPYSVYQLRTQAGERGWTSIQQHANLRGMSNPIFRDALGVYNGVVLHESEYIPRTTGTPDQTHNLFLGCQSGILAFGNAYPKTTPYGAQGNGTYFSWVEDSYDYHNKTGVAAGSVFGIKKSTYTGDFGAGSVTVNHGCLEIRTNDAAP